LRLFEDVQYGQWGLVILAPKDALDETASMVGERPEDVSAGDLVIGTFLGDLQRLVVRCDPQAADFGRVIVGLPLDPRPDWPVVGENLADFFTKFLSEDGDHFWPH
jgi:hypothetical protein